MDLNLDDDLTSVQISAIEVNQLLPETNERIKQNAMLDDTDRELCKQVLTGGNGDANFTRKKEFLCWRNRIYVPQKLRQKVMQSEHDSKIAEHFGREGTLELITRNVSLGNMEHHIRKYCSECVSCQRTKAPRHARHGLLHPLELACKPWTHISTDCSTDLLESQGATSILVVVDQFTKMAHDIPFRKKDSTMVAKAYQENQWKYHGFPGDVVSNRDSTFTGNFFTDLYNYLAIKRSMSTAYHPQTDGQTECINQVIEAYSGCYCNYEHNDWASMLAVAEYSSNNLKHADTKISPFYTKYGIEPRTNWHTEIQFSNPVSEFYGHYRTEVHKKLKERLEVAVETMQKYYNQRRKKMEPLKKGELVMLNSQNIRVKHRCKKLEDKMLGPVEVVSVRSNLRYCTLKLPHTWKIHLVFNIDLLQWYKETDPKQPVVEIEADGNDWVMESIIASKPSEDNPKQHVILVKWKDCTQDENTWETYDNVHEYDSMLLEDCSKRNLAIERHGRFKELGEKSKIQRKLKEKRRSVGKL